jgi:hypothetical protein
MFYTIQTATKVGGRVWVGGEEAACMRRMQCMQCMRRSGCAAASAGARTPLVPERSRAVGSSGPHSPPPPHLTPPPKKTQAMVEGDVERPSWLNSSVHLYNTFAAWGDLLTSHRSFSRRAERMSSAMVFVYVCYIQLCRHMNGQYPYPFLRNLRQPHGFIGTVAVALLLFAGAFRVGQAINRRVRAVSLSIAGHGDTITILATKESRELRTPSGRSGGGGGGFLRRNARLKSAAGSPGGSPDGSAASVSPTP